MRQRRPALVLAIGTLDAHGLLWVLMITSAQNRRWLTDVPVSALSESGLPAASVVRCAKLATIEARDAQRMGTLTTSNRRQVASQVYSMLDHLMARKTR
ncbi:MAG: type II toxin-antitoxin system PemK/MazF family toxin [Candidatus Eremiobacteraeota bacterium]|nr:type II toxin-antitoxin system PemK/MazF family toxin [Candidatus Eremiobacteraeota bacterium]